MNILIPSETPHFHTKMTQTKQWEGEIEDPIFKCGPNLHSCLFNNTDPPIDSHLLRKNKSVQTVHIGIKVLPLFLC